jgi:4,5-DOPA dioxygenase extradiol
MKRRSVLKTISLGALGMSGLASVSQVLANVERRDDRMPVLFVGHGSPMNAIEDNRWSRAWTEIGATLRRPDAILCVSAHWQTKGVMVTAMERPQTIHDFYGFPDALQNKLYPAPGAPALARVTAERVTKASVGLDHTWGLDHGTWSVLVKMYPRADIPVFQLSLDATRAPAWHYELAGELKGLRDRGVLIMGSGNIVHNLRRLTRQHPDIGFDWAIEFDGRIKELIDKGDHRSIIDYQKLGQAALLSVPTNEHYLPLLYALAAKDEKEPVRHFNDATTMGGISMRSLVIG